METIHTQIPKMLRKIEIIGKKSQNWSLELKNAVLSTVKEQGCH